MMPLVYVAGPFRGEDNWVIECNIRRAEQTSLELLRLGASAVCPHTQYRYFQGALPDQVFIDATLAQLSRAHAIFMLPDWHRSEGARGERRFAFDHNIPIFDDLDEVKAWLQVCEARGMCG